MSTSSPARCSPVRPAQQAAEVERALVAPPDPTAAAFFLDDTSMQGAAIFHLARGLYHRKLFTTRDILAAAWQQAVVGLVRWKTRTTPNRPVRACWPSSRTGRWASCDDRRGDFRLW